MSLSADTPTSPVDDAAAESNTAVMTEPDDTAQHPRIAGNLLAPLRYRDFRLLLSGQLISVIGDNFYVVALPWLIFSNGGTAQDLGIVLSAYGVPRIGTVLLGGWLSDRLRPRRVMLSADSARMLLTAGLGALALWGHPTLWQLCAILALLGAFGGLFIPASWAIAPDVLPDDVLQAGNSQSFAGAQLANLAGPALAGVVVGFVSSGPAFVVDSATFAVSALTLAAMRSGRMPVARAAETTNAPALGTDAPPVQPDTAEPTLGFWRFLMSSRLFQLVLLLAVMLNLVYGGIVEVGLPALAQGPLHTGANGYGVMLAGFGAGALVGGLSGGLLVRVAHPWRINLLIWTMQGLAVAAIPLLGSMWGVEGATVALAAMGLCNGLGNVSFISLVQQSLPRHLMGRFMGALGFANFGLFPISAAVAGLLIGTFGPATIISGAGLLTILVIALAAIPPDIRRL